MALTLILPGPALAASSMVIGEVNWAGSSHSTADEWIELWNLGLQDQSLDGWRLEGASATPFVFDATQIIPAQQAFVIANYDETNAKSVLNVHPVFVNTDVALGNDRLSLELSDNTGAVVDRAGDGKKPAAGTTKPPTTMVRADPTLDGRDPTAWVGASTALNLDTEVVDQGTPGACDGCRGVPVPADVTSTISYTSSTVVNTDTTSTMDVPSFVTPSSTTVNTTSTTEFTPYETTSTLDVATSTLAFATTSTAEVSATTTFVFVDSASSTIPLTATTTLPETMFATTTVVVTTTIVSTTTTIAATTTVGIATTTTVVTSTALSTSTVTTPTAATNMATTAPSSPACRARLETIFPAPSSGPEWVQVSGCEASYELVGWSIHDAQGLIVTLTTLTVVQATDEGHLRILLPGQHLNNGGDTVALRGPENGLYDLVAYPSLKHDEHYVRRNDGTWWIPERVPIAIPDSTEPDRIVVPRKTSVPSLQQATVPTTGFTPVMIATHATNARSSVGIVRATSVTSVPLEEYLKRTKTTKPSATRPRKTVARTKSVSSHSSRSSMAASSSLTPHVVLHGMVGTPPNLIAKRQFILLNRAGKGLLIRLNGRQPSPNLGQHIDITGSLVTNDDGPHLEMRARDTWRPSSLKIDDPTPTADALATDAERGWNLVDVTGVVESRSGSTVHLTVGDDEVIAIIPAALGYRPARLLVGDHVRMMGVLDTTREPARLHPRLANEITLVESATRATHQTSARTHDSLPPWVPVTAASVTVAAGYGLRRLRTWYEERRLAQQLATAVEQLSSS